MYEGGLAGGVRNRIYFLREVHKVMPGNSSLAELVVGKMITQVHMGRNNIFITLKNKSQKR